MRIPDNSEKLISELLEKNNNCDIADLNYIASNSLGDLQSNNPDFLVFPQKFEKNTGVDESTIVFSLIDDKIKTGNIMGFVGRNSTQITISSRFSKDDKNDYFLHYMLQKVFSINILKFDQTPNKENIWNFLLYLFPYYLKKAYSQGMYKAYKREEYNDANVKGAIDVKRHILKNIPFMGKIAYTTREHSHNNNLTQLIRHTIEHIKTHPFGSGVLTSDSEVRDIVSRFIFVTDKSYNKNARLKVISANLKPALHPYFTEYTPLQKICLQILRHENIAFGKEKDKVYGLLFDGAWLWEEYLNTILKDCGFKHPDNKTGSKPIYLFSNESYRRYPDFWKDGFVLDAKYKNIDSKNIDRNDMHQIISYMHVLKASKGGFIYPYPIKTNEVKCESVGVLNGYGGNVETWGVPIPQQSESFENFIKTMKVTEENLKNDLKMSEPKFS